MAFDEQGQADTFERKSKSANAATTLLVGEVGFPPEDIIFDPNIFAVATGIEEHNNYGRRLHRSHRLDQEKPAARDDFRRRVQRVVLVPWQQRCAKRSTRCSSITRSSRA
jgi:hypothetical protein